FGREEWREHLPQILGGDARTGVLDLHDDRAVGARARADADLVLVGAAFGDGLSGVDDEVDEHLPQPALRREHGRDLAVVAYEAGAMADLVPRHAERGFEDTMHVDVAALRFVAAR